MKGYSTSAIKSAYARLAKVIPGDVSRCISIKHWYYGTASTTTDVNVTVFLSPAPSACCRAFTQDTLGKTLDEVEHFCIQYFGKLEKGS